MVENFLFAIFAALITIQRTTLLIEHNLRIRRRERIGETDDRFRRRTKPLLAAARSHGNLAAYDPRHRIQNTQSQCART